MNPEDYFQKQLEIEPVYQTEGVFYEPFFIFESRIQSLQRHWFLSKGIIKNHFLILDKASGHNSAEFDDLFDESIGYDVEYFPEYLRLSTISFSLSLLENLLISLSGDIAESLGKKVELDDRNIPYINKHILWLTRGCGVDVQIDKKVWKNLDAIRELRNRFIHKIDRDIPNQIRKVISDMLSESITNDKTVSDEFVDVAMKKIAGLVKAIELAVIEFYRSHHRNSDSI